MSAEVESLLLPSGAAQKLVLSATLPPPLVRMAGRYLRIDAFRLDIGGQGGGAVGGHVRHLVRFSDPSGVSF